MTEALDLCRQHLQILIEAARILSETSSLDPLLRKVEEAAREVLHCERATVFLLDQANNELYSSIATAIPGIRFPADKGIAGRSLQSKSVILVPDAYQDPRFLADIDRTTGFTTHDLLSIPMILPDHEVIGVLELMNKKEGSFTLDDRVIGQALGTFMGLAIKRQFWLDEMAIKKELEKELDIAHFIQQSQLPHEASSLRDFDVAGWNKAAEKTGGDFFDFFHPDPDRLGIMIADATGHGLGPALLITQCRSMLRSICKFETRLETIFSTMNDLLCHDLPDDRFVSMLFGFLNRKKHDFHYISAGLAPILFYEAKKEITHFLDCTSIPLGIYKGSFFVQASPIYFHAGDIFVSFTDGFSEWMNQKGERFGENRISQNIIDNRGRSSRELIQSIYKQVKAFSRGTKQKDDLTAVVIQRTDKGFTPIRGNSETSNTLRPERC